MADGCCTAAKVDRSYRRILIVALGINAVMFFLELSAGLSASSVSLEADSLDFLGDAGNYGISLFVLEMSLKRRATAALTKGLTMGLFGLWVLGSAAWQLAHDTLPHASTMGVVGLAALAAKLAVFGLLWSYRAGDSNMHSVWLCSRNDVGGNVAVLLASAGVLGTGRGWPDAVVAIVIALLALQGAARIAQMATRELYQELTARSYETEPTV